MKLTKKTIILIILFILNIYFSFKMLYAILLLKGIETLFRILLSFIVIIMMGIFIYLYYNQINNQKLKYSKITIVSIIYILILLISSKYILRAYKSIKNMSSNTIIYSSSLVTLVENKSYKLENIGSGSIGIINDYNSVDGNILPKEIIEKEKINNKVVEYNDYVTLLDALYNKEVDYIFLTTNYVDKFKNIDEEKYKNIDLDTKIIYTKEKSIITNIDNKNINKEPFSILIMGVDSKEKNLDKSSFNGDALMLITFNPKTLNTTILSIPRDSYVPISCFNNEYNKITHAAMYGEECMIKTIENFTDIKIDYYVKINFKGVVDIIDYLNGIEVDVPYSFCEQDSNRKWGNNTIYVEKGKQILNGEQALALSRNRKNNKDKCDSKWTQGVRSDFIRGENQQIVLKAILNKLKEIDNLDKILNILDKVSNSIRTNLTENQILSLYNIGKDILIKSNNSSLEDLIGIQKLTLNGYGKRIYDKRTNLNLYNYVLYDSSIKEVSNEMKINLEIEKPNLIKEFKFNINEEYKEKTIGNKVDEEDKVVDKKEEVKTKINEKNSIITLPNLVGKDESEARTIIRNLGLRVTIKYESSSNQDGKVIFQNYNVGTDISKIDNLILTVAKVDFEKTEENDDIKKNEENNNIGIEDITGIELE